MIRKLKDIEKLLEGKEPGRVAVVAAHDDNVLSSLKETCKNGFAE